MPYVRVTSRSDVKGRGSDEEEEDDDEVIELPTEEDLSLSLATLEGQFPGAVGLQFRSPTGSLRGVRICDGYLKEPEDGWGSNTLYFCVFPSKKAKDVAQADKRSKVLKECVDLIVLGIPYSTTSDELARYFEQFGPVATVEIKTNPMTGKSKGFGFVRFRDYSAQVRALSARHNIGGRWCNINLPKSKHDPSEPETVSLPNRIFVSKVPPGMNQTHLRDYFASYGEIEDVFLPNPPRGFAFVTFRDLDVAEKLVDGQHFVNGIPVNVSLAMTKDSCFAAGLCKGPHVRMRSGLVQHQHHHQQQQQHAHQLQLHAAQLQQAHTHAQVHQAQLHHHARQMVYAHPQPADQHQQATWPGDPVHQHYARTVEETQGAPTHQLADTGDIHGGYAAYAVNGDKTAVPYVGGDAYSRYATQYGFRNFPGAGAYMKTSSPAMITGRGVRRGPHVPGPPTAVPLGIPYRYR